MEYWVLVIQWIFTVEEIGAMAKAFKVLLVFTQW